MPEADSQQPPVITVPERHALALSKFASLSGDKQEAMFRVAGEVPASSGAWAEQLREAMGDECDIGVDDAKALTSAIMGLFYVRQRASDRTDSDFIHAAVRGVQNAAPDMNVGTAAIQKVLVNILALKNLELAYRAGRVRFDHALHMHDAGIVTDIRPIFDLSASAIEGAVITHVLKIDYASNFEDDKNIYLAVDDSDLDKLESVIKRARRKAISLRSFAETTNLRIVED